MEGNARTALTYRARAPERAPNCLVQKPLNFRYCNVKRSRGIGRWLAGFCLRWRAGLFPKGGHNFW
jgi:hypothetical protein